MREGRERREGERRGRETDKRYKLDNRQVHVFSKQLSVSDE